MGNLVDHAKCEFGVLGWPGDDEMQEAICDDILALLEVFSKQEHSGATAPYTVNLFRRLAAFEPISPLTGEDSEWTKVSKGMWQNKRDSEVFKGSDGAYWICGRIFRDKDGSTYTSGRSSVPITFPWRHPKSQVVDVRWWNRWWWERKKR